MCLGSSVVIRTCPYHSRWITSVAESWPISPPTLTTNAVKVGVPKLGNCLEMYTRPSQLVSKHLYSSSVQGLPKLVHVLCTSWALAWAHVYIFKQFPSLGTPTSTAVIWLVKDYSFCVLKFPIICTVVLLKNLIEENSHSHHDTCISQRRASWLVCAQTNRV